MPTDPDNLRIIAEELVSNTNAADNKINLPLKNEAKRLEKAIIQSLNTIENYTQRDTFHFNILSKLVNICDILFDAAGTVNSNVEILLDMLTNIKRVIPHEIRPNLKLPKAFVEKEKSGLAEIWKQDRQILVAQQIDKKLIAIAAIPFERFIGEKKLKLYWGDYTWLKGYIAKLDILDWENADCSSPAEALISLLIGRDFNDDRFFIYCKKYIQARVAVISGKRLRLLEYAECEKLVLQDTQIGMPSFDLRANSVSTRLLKWVGEEIDFVETHEREVPYAKLHFNLYVNRVAFFFKLLHEQKLFGETSFKELSQQIASTCLSMDGEEISAPTIISKAYPKDQKMLEEMEELLVGMLEYVRRFMRKK